MLFTRAKSVESNIDNILKIGLISESDDIRL